MHELCPCGEFIPSFEVDARALGEPDDTWDRYRVCYRCCAGLLLQMPFKLEPVGKNPVKFIDKDAVVEEARSSTDIP